MRILGSVPSASMAFFGFFLQFAAVIRASASSSRPRERMERRQKQSYQDDVRRLLVLHDIETAEGQMWD